MIRGAWKKLSKLEEVISLTLKEPSTDQDIADRKLM